MLEGYAWFRPTDLKILFKALQSSPNPAILVGGQSLTFWVDFFKIEIPATNTPYLTQDADIFASKVDAKVIADNLARGTVVFPPPDDHTINNATITFEIGDRKFWIDVLGNLCGLDGSQIKETAIQLSVMDYGVVNILHPRLVLISRICNLLEIKKKRDSNGVTQAKLAVHAYREFLKWYRSFIESDEEYQKYLIEKAQELKKIALSKASKFVFKNYGIRVLDASPIEFVTTEKFLRHDWPNINKWFDDKSQ